jgi:flagellar hook-length control protein FliK
MIARAAGVDARVNNADASIAPPAVQTNTAQRASDSGGTPVPGNALQAARTTTLLTQAIAAASESNGGNASGNQTGGGTRNDDALTDAGASNKTAATPVAGPDSSTTLAVNAAAPPSSAPLAASQPQNAPATDLPAQSHVDPDAVVEQVVKSMMMRTASDGTSEVRLRLTPENLGSVMLKLTVQGNTVSATAIAQNADVRSALMSNQHQLTRSLAEAGLKLTGFSVDISGGNDRDRDTNDQTKGFGKRFTVHETGGTSAAESNENSSVGPSILPSSMLGLFNYLA